MYIVGIVNTFCLEDRIGRRKREHPSSLTIAQTFTQVGNNLKVPKREIFNGVFFAKIRPN
jgi:hypothetical protein